MPLLTKVGSSRPALHVHAALRPWTGVLENLLLGLYAAKQIKTRERKKINRVAAFSRWKRRLSPLNRLPVLTRLLEFGSGTKRLWHAHGGSGVGLRSHARLKVDDLAL